MPLEKVCLVFRKNKLIYKDSKEQTEQKETEQPKEHAHHEHKHHEHKEHHEPKEHHTEHAHHKKSSMTKSDMWRLIAGALAVLLIISIFTAGFGFKGSSSTADTGSVLSSDEAAEKAVAYINDNLLQAGTEATLSSVEEKDNLYVV